MLHITLDKNHLVFDQISITYSVVEDLLSYPVFSKIFNRDTLIVSEKLIKEIKDTLPNLTNSESIQFVEWLIEYINIEQKIIVR